MIRILESKRLSPFDEKGGFITRMIKTLDQLQLFLNTNDIDYDTLKELAEKKGYTLEHYVLKSSFYTLEKKPTQF